MTLPAPVAHATAAERMPMDVSIEERNLILRIRSLPQNSSIVLDLATWTITEIVTHCFERLRPPKQT